MISDHLNQLTRLLIFAYLCFSLGCHRQAERQPDYDRLWIDSAQANPGVITFSYLDERNLLNSSHYAKHRTLMTEDALTDVLKSMMQSFGINTDLAGLSEVLGQPLKSPQDTPREEVGISAWKLGVRNVFFGTEPDKLIELHYGASGIELLALRKPAGGSSLVCYQVNEGLISEYIYEQKEQRDLRRQD